MIIYRTWSAEGYQRVLLVDEDGYAALWSVLQANPGTPVGTRWVPPRVRMLTELRDQRRHHGQQRKHADLPWYSSYVMAVTRQARTVLEDIVANDAEFLPLECEEEELWLMHPWRSVLAFDAENSDFELLSTGRISEVNRYACVHSGGPMSCGFGGEVQFTSAGSQGLPARARVMASRAVSPWFAAESR
jgi:hypothetical protein